MRFIHDFIAFFYVVMIMGLIDISIIILCIFVIIVNLTSANQFLFFSIISFSKSEVDTDLDVDRIHISFSLKSKVKSSLLLQEANRILYEELVLIPHGPIKSIIIMCDHGAIFKFQFRMVQLKDFQSSHNNMLII